MQRRAGRYRDLDAWQKAYGLARQVYEVTREFPADERFGLTQQMRRASVAIPSNIAEGWGRNTTTDYIRFLGIARGSLYELETQLALAQDLGYLDCASELDRTMDETERLINALVSALRRKVAATRETS